MKKKTKLGRNPFQPKAEAKVERVSPEPKKASKRKVPQASPKHETDEPVGFLEQMAVRMITLSIFAYIVAKTAFERTTGQST